MDIYNIGILGAGAVGAALTHQIGNPLPPYRLTIIADGERAERYRSDGFSVNGDNVRPAVDSRGTFDLIILATKSYHLESALPLLDGCMGPKTLVLSLLNGIASEKTLSRRYTAEQIVPAMILGIDALKDRDGFRYLNRGRIFFGANPEIEDHNDAICALRVCFDGLGLVYEVSPDIEKTLWHKFMINVGINQASAVLDAEYGEFQKEGEARDLMLGAVREVVELSKLEGTGLDESNIESWLEVLAGLNPIGKTSMLQDAQAGRRMEIDLFADTVVALAEKHGLKVPVNRELKRRLELKQPLPFRAEA